MKPLHCMNVVARSLMCVASRDRNPGGRRPAKGRCRAAKARIAEFVTLGLTNIEIAERLSVSSKTVEKHLSSIFVKLGIRSRAQIAAFITREERARV